MAEFDIRDGGYDFRKERSCRRVFLFLKPDGQMRYKSNETIKEVKALTFGMPITQGRVSHVCKFDVAF